MWHADALQCHSSADTSWYIPVVMPSLWHVLGLMGDRCTTAPEDDVTVKNTEATCSFMCTKTDVHVMKNVVVMWVLSLEDKDNQQWQLNECFLYLHTTVSLIWIMVHTDSGVVTRTCLASFGGRWSCYTRVNCVCRKYGGNNKSFQYNVTVYDYTYTYMTKTIWDKNGTPVVKVSLGCMSCVLWGPALNGVTGQAMTTTDVCTN